MKCFESLHYAMTQLSSLLIDYKVIFYLIFTYFFSQGKISFFALSYHQIHHDMRPMKYAVFGKTALFKNFLRGLPPFFRQNCKCNNLQI